MRLTKLGLQGIARRAKASQMFSRRWEALKPDGSSGVPETGALATDRNVQRTQLGDFVYALLAPYPLNC